MSPSTASKITTDHNEILRWAKTRTAKPATAISDKVKANGGIIRLDFGANGDGGSGQAITWEDWFAKFEELNLAFLYQDQLANGEHSNFYQIVERETAKKVEEAVGGKGRSALRRGKSGRAKVESDNLSVADPDARRATALKKPVAVRSRVSSRVPLNKKTSSQADDQGSGKPRPSRTTTPPRSGD